jgi:hypothetical protein
VAKKNRKTETRLQQPAEPVRPRPAGDGGGLPNLPGWAPVVLYSVLALFLFREFVFTNRMLLGTDTLSLGYMARQFFADALATTGFPGWNPVILGGTPFLESVAGGDSLYPTSVLLLFMETYRAIGWKLVLHLPVAGGLMYLWTRSLGVSRVAGLLAGLAFTLAPYMISLVYPAQDGKLFVTALTPLVFWTADGFMRRGGLLWLGGLAMAVGLVILTTHFQMAYFLFGTVGVLAIVRTVQFARGSGPWEAEAGAATGAEPTSDAEPGSPPELVPESVQTAVPTGPGRRTPAAVMRFALFLVAAVMGAGVAGVQLLPSFDYVLSDSRRTATTTEAAGESGVIYSSSWSLHPEEAMSFIVPEFAGNSAGGSAWATQTYWGRNVFKLNHEYIGLLVLVLAGLSFLGAPQKGLRWYLTGMGAVVFLFTLGAHTPVWRLFYAVVPGISLFRAPSMAIFLTGFAATTLMAFGLDRAFQLARGSEEEGSRLIRYFAGWSGALLVLLLLVGTGILFSIWTSVIYPDMAANKADALARATPFIRRGAFIAFLLVAATGSLFWAVRSRMLPLAIAVPLLAGLLALDLIRVNLPFIQTLDYHQWAAPDEHERMLRDLTVQSDEPFRVLSMMGSGQDVRPGMFGVELAAGHHPNDLARYRELIGMVGSGAPTNFFESESGGFNRNLFGVLNVRFLLWPDYQFGPLPVEPVTRLSSRDGQPYSSVYELPFGLPRARLVAGYAVTSAGEGVGTLLSDEFDAASRVLLEEEPDPAWGLSPLGSGTASGSVRWMERGPDRMVLEVEVSEPALLAVSQNWMPGWVARVGAEEWPVLRANHTLQAIPVPAGSHTLELAYEPPVVRSALWVSVVSLLLAGAAVGVGAARTLRAGRGDRPDPRPETAAA